jgi:glucose/arabinose dehydrogenase
MRVAGYGGTGTRVSTCRLRRVINGLNEPTYVVAPPDGSDRLFVLEREGLVRLTSADGDLKEEPLLDLTHEASTVDEQGLLGMAVHPEFEDNGLVYVDSTAMDGSVHGSESPVRGAWLDEQSSAAPS